jgi:glycosyltransferase involved in cell wall biosynthesis
LIVPGKLVSLESITIAAVIPVHNPKEAWFRELIESLKGNMFEEIIFLYSGANVEYLKALATSSLPNSINLNLENFPGITDKTNVGLKSAKSDYVVLIDHDDVILPQASEILKFAIKKNNFPDILITDHKVIPEKSVGTNILRNFETYKPLALDLSWFSQTNYWVHAVAMKTEFLSMNGFMDPDFEYAQDYELWLRMLNCGAKVEYSPIMIYGWRTHAQSVASGSLAKPEIALRAAKAIENYFDVKNIETIVNEVILNGSSTGVYRANPKNMILTTSRKVLSLKCITGMTHAASESIMKIVPNGWTLIYPNCFDITKIHISPSSVVHVRGTDPKAAIIGIPVCNRDSKIVVMSELDSQNNVIVYDTNEVGPYFKFRVVRRIESLATPVFMICTELVDTVLNSVEFENCYTLGLEISDVIKKRGYSIYLDGQSWVVSQNSWIENHDSFEARNLFKAM